VVGRDRGPCGDDGRAHRRRTDRSAACPWVHGIRWDSVTRRRRSAVSLGCIGGQRR
jgi:hypothetical protein